MTVVTTSDLIEAARRQQAQLPIHASVAQPTSGATPKLVVSVVGAHPCAGATSVATALADAAAASSGRKVTLIGLTSSRSQTIRGVADVEVESRVPGLRAGKRNRIQVFAHLNSSDADVDLSAALSDVSIIDGPSSYSNRTVVVCRPTVPSTQAAAHTLRASGSDVVLAVLGAKRWPRAVAMLLSPALHQADEQERVVFVPDNPTLRTYGVDTSPTPGPILAATTRLLTVLCPDLVGTHTHHRTRSAVR